jgi:hypothetical protein
LVAPEPAQRFANANAARIALDDVSAGKDIVPIERVARKPRGPRWLRPLAMAAAGLGLVAGGFGVRALLVEHESHPRPVFHEYGSILFELKGETPMTLTLDGKLFGPIPDNYELPIFVGKHDVRLESKSGKVCMQADVNVWSQSSVTLTCEVGKQTATTKHNDPITFGPNAEINPKQKPTVESLPAGTPVDLDFKDASLHDVVRTISDKCGLSVVTPDNIDAKISINLKKAPCDQALEVLLESHGLWYRYVKAGNLILVAPRMALDREAEAQIARARAGTKDDTLPDGPELDLDFKNAPLHDLLRIFADLAKVNLVVPNHIDAKVTIKLKKAPWKSALAVMLESHGLWYRYRENGKLLRIAPRMELDREDEAERARNRTR